MTYTKEEVAAEMSRPENARRTDIEVYVEGDEYVAEWDGVEVRSGNPFGLDSELSRIGAPEPRNLFLMENNND